MTTENYSYRPSLSYGEVWGTSFRLAWRRPSLWLWGFFVAGGPIQLYQMFKYGPGLEASFNMLEQGWSGYLIYITLALVFYLAFDAFFSPMLIYSVSEIETKGDYDIGVAAGEGAARWGWFIAFTLLTIAAIGIVVFALILFGAATSLISGWLTALAMIFLIPAAIVIGLGLAFVIVYARRFAVIEGRAFVESISTGYEFLMSNKAATLVLTLTLVGVFIVVGIIYGIFMVLSAVSSGGFPTLENYEPTPPGVGSWMLGIINLLSAPLSGTIITNLFTVLYLRLRKQPAMSASAPIPPPVIP